MIRQTSIVVTACILLLSASSAAVWAQGDHGNQHITLEKDTFRIGERIQVRWHGLPGNRQDWITVVPAASADESWADHPWWYTDGDRDGTRTIIMPLAAGRYEVRVFFDWPKGGFAVRSRLEFTVGDAPRQPEGTHAGQETEGPDGGVYVWVPAGDFLMGSEWEGPDERERPNEEPRHRVHITRGFWLGKHEVTNEQYRRFCEATGRRFPWDSGQDDDHPVVHVSWEDAQAYCAHYGLRLPTEAEWEWAARGLEGRLFPWGNEWDGKALCWRENRGPGRATFAVGSFPAGASWVGALDMAGNVSEWVQDWYHERAYWRAHAGGRDPSIAIVNPLQRVASQAPLTHGQNRVRRGGCWGSVAGDCRAASRSHAHPGHHSERIGFRCAISPPGR